MNKQGFWEGAMGAVTVNGKSVGLNNRTAILDTGPSRAALASSRSELTVCRHDADRRPAGRRDGHPRRHPRRQVGRQRRVHGPVHDDGPRRPRLRRRRVRHRPARPRLPAGQPGRPDGRLPVGHQRRPDRRQPAVARRRRLPQERLPGDRHRHGPHRPRARQERLSPPRALHTSHPLALILISISHPPPPSSTSS